MKNEGTKESDHSTKKSAKCQKKNFSFVWEFCGNHGQQWKQEEQENERRDNRRSDGDNLHLCFFHGFRLMKRFSGMEKRDF